MTIEIPDNETSAISQFIKEKGGHIIEVDSEDMTEEQLSSLKKSYIEALKIESGELKAIPISDLWNENE